MRLQLAAGGGAGGVIPRPIVDLSTDLFDKLPHRHSPLSLMLLS